MPVAGNFLPAPISDCFVPSDLEDEALDPRLLLVSPHQMSSTDLPAAPNNSLPIESHDVWIGLS